MALFSNREKVKSGRCDGCKKFIDKADGGIVSLNKKSRSGKTIVEVHANCEKHWRKYFEKEQHASGIDSGNNDESCSRGSRGSRSRIPISPDRRGCRRYK